MLAGVDGEDVGLQGDVVGEGLLAHRTRDPLAGKHLLNIGVVVGRSSKTTDGDVVSAGVLTPRQCQRSLTSLKEATIGNFCLALPITWSLEAMSSLVSVHVPIGGEGLSAEGA